MSGRKLASQIMALLLVSTTVAYAQGNSWKKVRYNGGTLQTKVSPKTWDNNLAVTSDEITFRLKDGQQVQIPTGSVTGLSYGQEAHRRVGTMIALGILVTPLALFGLFNKTRLHFIGIDYKKPDGKGAGLLLQGDKNNYRAILMALKSATGAPLAVAEADRKYVPTGVTAAVAPSSETKVEAQKSAAAPTPASAPTPVAISEPAALPTQVQTSSQDSPTSMPQITPAVATQIVDSTGTAITIAEPTVALTDTTAKETLPITADAPNNPSETSSPTTSATASQLAALPLNTYVTNAGAATPSSADGTASITSSPDGAEIFVDSVGSGHAPSLAKLKPGKHTVQLVMAGHKDWTSEIEVTSGSIVNVTGNLEIPVQP